MRDFHEPCFGSAPPWRDESGIERRENERSKDGLRNAEDGDEALQGEAYYDYYPIPEVLDEP